VSLLQKGAITRRGGLPTFKPIGLAPQKAVANAGGADALRDTFQRKVVYDGTRFFIVYWNATTKDLFYTSSLDAVTWEAAVSLGSFSVGPYYGGNADVLYPNNGALTPPIGESFQLSICFSGSNGANWYGSTYNIVGATLSNVRNTQMSSGSAQGGSLALDLDASTQYWVLHGAAYLQLGEWATGHATSTDVPHGGTTTGGAQILPYKTASPYKLFVLAKGGDNKLYYNVANDGVGSFVGSFAAIATLGTGFSDWCACTEAQGVGDPEIIHMVYIKSTGELCYQKFESDALGSEVELAASGASYPVIACGTSDRLYVFYVKSGKIWLLHFDGSTWQTAIGLFTSSHSYNTPAYLSCNQNVQSGKICLVWVEGTSTYEVWFCYLED